MISDVINMEAIVQFGEAWKSRQEILANGDRDLQTQEAAKADNAAIYSPRLARLQHIASIWTSYKPNWL
jgi:hypothetical protein